MKCTGVVTYGICSIVSFLHFSFGEPELSFEYNYSLKRNALIEEEQKLAGYQQTYSKDEQIVNNYLEYLKWLEFNRTKHDFPASLPLKLHFKEVKDTKVYKLLKTFPKGGNMHLHHNNVVSKKTLFDIVYKSPFYDNLFIKTDHPGQYNLNFFVDPPQGWAQVKDNKEFPKELILQHATFLGIIDDKAINEPTDSELRWAEMQPLFGVIGSDIISLANISKLHMEAMLQAAMDENVQYFETKSSASNKLYVLDKDPQYAASNGKRSIDNDYGESELSLINDVVKEFKIENPEFIGYKRIISSFRGGGEKSVKIAATKALYLYERHPDLVAGFDLVAEEDKGYSLLYFVKDFAELSNENITLPYFFHTAETNWPEDLIASPHGVDPLPTLENVYDAILLGAKRIGHGVGYIKHPYLMEVLRERNIAIEINPLSNKLLGYVPDQRHHPAITYLRNGIPIVMGADDPSTFGYDEFTFDWYEGFMSWGLNLADLRHIAKNSLEYSSLSPTEKASGISKWEAAYDKFITSTVSQACQESFLETNPSVNSIFPRAGSIEGGTKIQVFGRHLEMAVCQDIICQFGNITTKGVFRYTHRVECISPSLDSQPELENGSVELSISLDGGKTFLPQTFTFVYLGFENS